MLLIKASLTTMAAFQMTYLFFLHVVRTVATHTKYDCCTQCAYDRDKLQVMSLMRIPVVPPIMPPITNRHRSCAEDCGNRQKHDGLHIAKCNWIFILIINFYY